MPTSTLSTDCIQASRELRKTAIGRIAEIFGSEWIMVVFYGDESGTHGEGDYVISGYLSHKTTWDFFGKCWNEALQAPTPYPIEYLKMSEWEHRYPSKKGNKGQFLGWSDFDANTKLLHLISVLNIFLRGARDGFGGLMELTCSISWDLYRRCVNGHCREVFSNPYYFNLRQITLQAIRSIKERDPAFDGKIDFVFDEGNSAELNAPKHFAYTKRYADPILRNCIGTISFANDRDEPALQAADLIAWHTRRSLAGIDPIDDVRAKNYRLVRDSARSYCRDAVQEDRLIAYNTEVNALVDFMGRLLNKEEAE